MIATRTRWQDHMRGMVWMVFGMVALTAPIVQATEINASAPLLAGPYQYVGVYMEEEGTPGVGAAEATVGVVLYEETNGVNGLQVEWTCADGGAEEGENGGYFCEDGSQPAPPDREAFHQEYAAELE